MSFLEDTMVILKRELLIFRSRIVVNTIRAIIFPIVILVFFGNLGFSAHNISTAIVNLANNNEAIRLINNLELGGVLSIKGMTSYYEGISMLNSGSVELLIVIEPTFPGPNSVAVYYKSSNYQFVSSAFPFVQNAVEQLDSKAEFSPVQSQVTISSTAGGSVNYATFLVGGIIILICIFSSIFGSGFSTILEKQLGILKALFLTPLSKAGYVSGKVLSTLIQSLVYVYLVLLLSIPLGVSIAMSEPAGILWITILAALPSIGFSAISLILASKINRPDAFAIFANSITLPLWFISGAFFPTSLMPSWMVFVSNFNPLTYSVTSIRGVMINGFIPSNYIAETLAVLISFDVFAFALCMKTFKVNIA
ncbi:MAG: ABC transporter permease [Candidatus Micrarchaeaceae archaeon]